MEIESFMHGAMGISYSGRCLLSNFFTGRDANQGACCTNATLEIFPSWRNQTRRVYAGL